jgi:hypothetical protein
MVQTAPSIVTLIPLSSCLARLFPVRRAGFGSGTPPACRPSRGKWGLYRASSRSVGLSPFSGVAYAPIGAAMLNTSMRLTWNLRCARLGLAKYLSKFAAKFRSKYRRWRTRLYHELCLSFHLDLNLNLNLDPNLNLDLNLNLNLNLNPQLFVALRMTSCRSKYPPLFVRKFRQKCIQLRARLHRQVRW